MVYDLDMLKAFYASFEKKIGRVRAVLQRPLTLAEKILYTHLYDDALLKKYKRGEDYVNFRPDRVAMQDATAQMALLQFINAGKETVAVPSTVHCDHLIQAYKGAGPDIATATESNREVYDFLRDVSSRFGIGFWKPGAGIIHQVVLENYAFPGGMMVGTDSHTPNAGGLGMVAISGVLLWAIPNYMIPNEMGIAIFRGNHGYQLCGLTDPQGVILRLLMYLVSFVVVYTMLALVPDIKLPLTYVGRHTMGIYFFHYPIMIIMNGLYILMLPVMNNVWVLLGVSLVFVLVLGSLPVDLLYTGVLNLIAFILIKKDKTVRDEGLEEEYDSEYDEYELLRRKKAIAELAATLDSESEQDGHMEKVNMDEDTPEHTSSDRHEGFSNVAGMELEIEEDNLDDIPDELIKGEEELSLEDLIQELEATTRTMDDNKEP